MAFSSVSSSSLSSKRSLPSVSSSSVCCTLDSVCSRFVVGDAIRFVVPKKPLAHLVALVTGYQRSLPCTKDMQHLLPAAKHAFPQHPPPSPQGKSSPLTFLQQEPPRPTHTLPQQLSRAAHWKGWPCLFLHFLLREVERSSDA